MATFSGNTLTETGKIHKDTVDADNKYYGFGNLITDDGGNAINSAQPFQNKVIPSGAPPKADYTKIKGYDVKLVHGDRWQELEALMTENVQKDFKTTIGVPPWIQPKKDTDPDDLNYNDPSDDLNLKPPSSGSPPDPPITPGSANHSAGPWDYGNGAQDGLPPSSSTEANQVDPGTGQARYILDVRGDQKTAIGGDVSLWVAGYSDTVQIGQYSASYFSQYIKNQNNPQYHNSPDSYVCMNNDYKIVYDTKFRNVYLKQDIAKWSMALVEFSKLEAKLSQAAAIGAAISAGLVNLGFWVLANDALAMKSLVAACEPKAAPEVDIVLIIDLMGCGGKL